MKVLKILLTAVVTLASFAAAMVQILEHFEKKKAAISESSASTVSQQAVVPKDVPKPKSKPKSLPKIGSQRDPAVDGTLKAPVQTNSRNLNGNCSYTIKNDSPYQTRFILKHVEKQLGERELVRVFLPPNTSHTVTQLPEGTLLVNYCLGSKWDAAKRDFQNTEVCRDTVDTLAIEIERKIVDGEIIKKKKCEETIRIGQKRTN